MLNREFHFLISLTVRETQHDQFIGPWSSDHREDNTYQARPTCKTETLKSQELEWRRSWETDAGPGNTVRPLARKTYQCLRLVSFSKLDNSVYIFIMRANNFLWLRFGRVGLFCFLSKRLNFDSQILTFNSFFHALVKSAVWESKPIMTFWLSTLAIQASNGCLSWLTGWKMTGRMV